MGCGCEGAERSVGPASFSGGACSASDAGTGAGSPIAGGASLVDEVVDIIEAQLHDQQREADADPKTTEAVFGRAGLPAQLTD